MKDELEIKVLGICEVKYHGKEISLSEKYLILFVYLAIEGVVQRTELETLLWDAEEGSRVNIDRAVTDIHKGLITQTSTPKGYFLVNNKQPRGLSVQNISIDVLKLKEQLKIALEDKGPQSLKKVLDLYPGEFLEEIDLEKFPEKFKTWVSKKREQYKALLPLALTELRNHYNTAKIFGAAVETAERLSELLFDSPKGVYKDIKHQLDAFNEIWFRYIELLGHMGLCRWADEVYDDYKNSAKKHNILTSNSLAELIAKIRQNGRVTIPNSDYQAHPEDFLERDEEHRQLVSLIIEKNEKNVRLMVLTGPSGVGKTTLVQHVINEVRVKLTLKDKLTQAVCYVSFDRQFNPTEVLAFIANNIATQFNVREPIKENPKQFIESFLTEHRILLVLDHFDHLLSTFDDIYSLADNQKLESHIVLVCQNFDNDSWLPNGATNPHKLESLNSHHRGRPPKKVVYLVKPLAISDHDHYKTPDALLLVPSVRLFLYYLRRNISTFKIEYKQDIKQEQEEQETLATTSSTLVQINRICHLLNGLPGAIRSIASILTKENCTAEGLEKFADALAIHLQTHPSPSIFRSSVEFSYNFSNLSDHTKELLKDLSVFAGHFTDGDVRKVWRELTASIKLKSDYGMFRDLVISSLPYLHHKSFIQLDSSQIPDRYYLLNTTREFLQAELEQNQREELRRNHANYFATKVKTDLKDEEKDEYEQELIRCRADINEAWSWLAEKQRENQADRGINELILHYAQTAALQPLQHRYIYADHVKQLRATLLALKTRQFNDDRNQKRFLLTNSWNLPQEMKEALDYYEQSIIQADISPLERSKALLGIGKVYDYLTPFTQSFASLAQINLAMARQLATLEKEGTAIAIYADINKGDGYLLDGEISPSVGMYRRALKSAPSIPDKTVQIEILIRLHRSLGFAYLWDKKPGDAKESFKKCLALLGDSPDPHTLAVTNWGLALAQLEEERYLALKLMKELPSLMLKEQHPEAEEFLAQLQKTEAQVQHMSDS